MAKKPGRKLNDAHRAFLVREMACYMSPKDAAAALREETGIEITPQSAEHYCPGKLAAKNLAAKWVELFEVTREAFLKHIENHIPEAHKAVRIQKLAKASRAMEGARNWVGMADMLERIAKELGNVHTNRRELTGKDGKPMEFKPVEAMSLEEIKAELMSYGFDPTAPRVPLPAPAQPGEGETH